MTLVTTAHHDWLRGTAAGFAQIGSRPAPFGPPVGGVLSAQLIWLPFLVIAVLLVANLAAQLSLGCALLQIKPGSCGTRSYVAPGAHGCHPAVADDGSEWRSLTEGGTVPLIRRADSPPDQGPNLRLLRDHAAQRPVHSLIWTHDGARTECGGHDPTSSALYRAIHPDLSTTQIGLIFGSATLTYLIFTPIAGCISDTCSKIRSARWSCLLIGMVFLGLAMLSFSSGTEWASIFGGLVGVGIALAFIDAPSMALLADVIDIRGHSESLGSVFAVQDTCVSFGFALGPILGALPR